MAEPRGAWARPRPSTSKTPQSRSSNASPAPTNPTNPPAKAAPAPAPTANVWAERASRTAAQKSSSAAPKEAPKKEESPAPVAVAQSAEQHAPVNGFNAAEVREFLQRGPKVAPYKPADDGASKGGSTWGTKANNTANGQAFFAQLSKQVAALQPK